MPAFHRRRSLHVDRLTTYFSISPQCGSSMTIVQNRYARIGYFNGCRKRDPPAYSCLKKNSEVFVTQRKNKKCLEGFRRAPTLFLRSAQVLQRQRQRKTPTASRQTSKYKANATCGRSQWYSVTTGSSPLSSNESMTSW